jgi:hypothetical protein
VVLGIGTLWSPAVSGLLENVLARVTSHVQI